MWFVQLLSLFLLYQVPVLVPDEALILTLQPGAGPLEISYEGRADEVIRVTARSVTDSEIDATLEILFDGQRVAFDDDDVDSSAGLKPLDAAVENLPLSESGTYILRLNTFSGAQGGAIELRLQSTTAIQPCMSVPVNLLVNTVFTCRLDLDTGQKLNAVVRDTSGALDPVLWLLSDSDSVLVQNDDHDGTDLTLNTLDARIDNFTPAESGVYWLQIREFAGQAGSVDLILEISA